MQALLIEIILMSYFDYYDVIIFDCDGVILNSNTMKISAMCNTLKQVKFPTKLIEPAIIAFMNNFGKSRTYHCRYFVETLLKLKGKKSTELQENILLHYTQAVEDEYLQVSLCEDFLALLTHLSDKVFYVASGSEQEQLIRIFKKRALFSYFKSVLGSPETKSNNVAKILHQHNPQKVLFVGDSVADFEAAVDNSIDFLFYSPYSNVTEKMLTMSKTHHFPVLNSYRECLL